MPEEVRRFPRLAPAQGKGVSDRILRKVVTRINKMYSKNREADELTLTTFGESVFSKPRPYIPTGIYPLDSAVCFGRGFPTGIIEIFGPEASGKTAVMEHTIAEAQRLGYYTIVFAQEYSMDDRRAVNVGIDRDRLLMPDAETIEDVYDKILSIVREIRKKDTETPIVVGWDSVAATPTRSELEHKAGLEASDMAGAARQMSKLFRRLVRFLFYNNVCLICINQIRANVGQMYGPKESTFGGKALRFYAWVRCRIRSKEIIKNSSKKEIGILAELRVVKNKVAPPFKECLLPIYWTKGIDAAEAAWHYATELNVVERKGTTYRLDGQVMTKKHFRKYYENHKTEINDLCRSAAMGLDEEE